MSSEEPRTPPRDSPSPVFSTPTSTNQDEPDFVDIQVVPNSLYTSGTSIVITVEDEEDVEAVIKAIESSRVARRLKLKRQGVPLTNTKHKQLRMTPIKQKQTPEEAPKVAAIKRKNISKVSLIDALRGSKKIPTLMTTEYVAPTLKLNATTMEELNYGFASTTEQFKLIKDLEKRLKDVRGALLYLNYRINGKGIMEDIWRNSEDNKSIDVFSKGVTGFSPKSIKCGLVVLIINYVASTEEDLSKTKFEYNPILNQKDLAIVFGTLKELEFEHWTTENFKEKFNECIQAIKEKHRRIVEELIN